VYTSKLPTYLTIHALIQIPENGRFHANGVSLALPEGNILCPFLDWPGLGLDTDTPVPS